MGALGLNVCFNQAGYLIFNAGSGMSPGPVPVPIVGRVLIDNSQNLLSPNDDTEVLTDNGTNVPVIFSYLLSDNPGDILTDNSNSILEDNT